VFDAVLLDGLDMLVVPSHNGVPVRLTEERWRHIVQRHVEMVDLRREVLETVAGPDVIQQGDFGELLAVRFYPQTPLGGKYLVVAYREITLDEGFVLTAYLTNAPSRRRTTLWKR